jgi:peptide/nickel transport system ATP-binding protein
VKTNYGLVQVVKDVSLDINKGEIVALVGESGSGKTMTALSIVGLLPEPQAKIESGNIFFEDLDLAHMEKEELRKIRGKRVSIIFQDSMTALNPIMICGQQIVEEIKAHDAVSNEEAHQRTIELFRSVGIPEPEVRFRQHPFEMSGGMRQRVMIAMALACSPSLIIADEPTTNLDVSIQAQILELLKTIRDNFGASILIITHNLGIVAWLCDRVYVMYGGQILESGPMEKLLTNPSHPYTTLLLKSIPRADERRTRLESIPGDVPDLARPPSACVFHPRCPDRRDNICNVVAPELLPSGENPNEKARCLKYDPEYADNW